MRKIGLLLPSFCFFPPFFSSHFQEKGLILFLFLFVLKKKSSIDVVRVRVCEADAAGKKSSLTHESLLYFFLVGGRGGGVSVSQPPKALF